MPFIYIYTDMYTLRFKAISLKVVLSPNKIMNMKNLKFCFYFCSQYALSHTIPLYVFDFSFLKIILQVVLMRFYSAKHTCNFFELTCYNFKTKWLPIPYS